ncbi:MAG: hypothetical protein Q4P34_02870 [Tissierellia bacterium]|nr:hypothetical protein [Tissierellia bacterium]
MIMLSDEDKENVKAANFVKEDDLRETLINFIANYIYELGQLELQKYMLEYELTKTNRNLEILSESLTYGNEVDVNKIFQISNDEFYKIESMIRILKNDINKIINAIEEEKQIEDIDSFIGRINKTLSTLHPDYRSVLNKWSNIDWSNGKYPLSKTIDNPENIFDSNDIIKLKNYLPKGIIDAVDDDDQFKTKKGELIQSISDLESIKAELEQLFLALLPVEDNYIN